MASLGSLGECFIRGTDRGFLLVGKGGVVHVYYRTAKVDTLNIHIASMVLEPKDMARRRGSIKPGLMAGFNKSLSRFYNARIFSTALCLVIKALSVRESESVGKTGNRRGF